jgi:hypothetical protein
MRQMNGKRRARLLSSLNCSHYEVKAALQEIIKVTESSPSSNHASIRGIALQNAGQRLRNVTKQDRQELRPLLHAALNDFLRNYRAQSERSDGIEKNTLQFLLACTRGMEEGVLRAEFMQELFEEGLGRVERAAAAAENEDVKTVAYVQECNEELLEMLRLFASSTDRKNGSGSRSGPEVWETVIMMDMLMTKWLPLQNAHNVLTGRGQRHASVLQTTRMLKLYWELSHRLMHRYGMMRILPPKDLSHVLRESYSTFIQTVEANSQNGLGPIMAMYNELMVYIEEDSNYFESSMSLPVGDGYERRLLRWLCDRVGLKHTVSMANDISVDRVDKEAVDIFGYPPEHDHQRSKTKLPSLADLLDNDANSAISVIPDPQCMWSRVLEPLPPYWQIMEHYLEDLTPKVVDQSVAGVLVSMRNSRPSVGFGLLLLDCCHLQYIETNKTKSTGARAITDGREMTRLAQLREQINFALIKMAANRRDIYGILEAIQAADKLEHKIGSQGWTLALHSVWAARNIVPKQIYRSCFSYILRKFQETYPSLNHDSTRIVLQYLVDTDPHGDLTWRLLGRLADYTSAVESNLSDRESEARSEDKDLYDDRSKDNSNCSSFVECVALSSLILSTIKEHGVGFKNPLQMTTPLYENEKYLYIYSNSNKNKDGYKYESNNTRKSERQLILSNIILNAQELDQELLKELELTWNCAINKKDRRIMEELILYGIEDADHDHEGEVEDKYQGNLDEYNDIVNEEVYDDGSEIIEGFLLGLENRALRDAFSILVVDLAFHIGFYDRDLSRAYSLLYAWATAQNIQDELRHSMVSRT